MGVDEDIMAQLERMDPAQRANFFRGMRKMGHTGDVFVTAAHRYPDEYEASGNDSPSRPAAGQMATTPGANPAVPARPAADYIAARQMGQAAPTSDPYAGLSGRDLLVEKRARKMYADRPPNEKDKTIDYYRQQIEQSGWAGLR